MRVLLAEDEAVTRTLLAATMTRFGYAVEVVDNGLHAFESLQRDDGPAVAVLDWNMPGLDGIDVCRRVRESGRTSYAYMLIVTARHAKGDVVAALSAGADDFISKPIDPDELRARLRVGERIVQLEQRLGQQVRDLKLAAEQVKQLEGMIPICMHCKKIRGGHDVWERIETYIEQRSEAKFSHALCTECLEKHYPGHEDEGD
jgi:phosphoserine phosphatase RsbU/P